ncbi:hypothetical protein Ae201684P_014660 [Aphanomyces euteiches]|nr:hypothetical protein Ae201684P_014660 [Aphanomyces euteiches]
MESSSSRALKCCALVSIHEEMNPTKRRSMEDALRVVDEFGGKSTDGFFGLYDGHGGREISTYLKENLHASVLNELSQDGAAADVPTCIQRAFVLTDADCCELQEAKNAGSTAAIAFIRQEGDVRALYAANVGDSRIVLCRNGKAERLTEDHKPDIPSEAMRICDAGGFVMHNRTSGVLAISRSFGDRELKKWVIAQPYQSRSILDASCSFVILACDGVWDEMDDQDAVDLILALPVSHRAYAAQTIVNTARDRGSCDNISAIVVFLG